MAAQPAGVRAAKWQGRVTFTEPGKGIEPAVACPDAFRSAVELPGQTFPGEGF